MTDIPEHDQTPEGPAYQGRRLARPHEDVVDQGAGFDLATLLTRRRVLSLVGLGTGATALAACDAGGSTSSRASSPSQKASAGDATSTGEIPEETNGPYPADGTNDVNVLEDSGIVRSDITSSIDGGTTVDGVPLRFTFNLVDIANDNAPFAGAALYAWQCDAQGRYSMYTSGVEDETFLRGIQVADSDGNLTFKTIVPGCYTGRWPHIHFEVYPDLASATEVTKTIATSQLAFPPAMLAKVYALDTYSGSTQNLAGVGTKIAHDDIFGDGDWKLQVPTITGDAESGYTATLTVSIDTSTTPTGGGSGDRANDGGPGGGGQPPSGRPPSGNPHSATPTGVS